MCILLEATYSVLPHTLKVGWQNEGTNTQESKRKIKFRKHKILMVKVVSNWPVAWNKHEEGGGVKEDHTTMKHHT